MRLRSEQQQLETRALYKPLAQKCAVLFLLAQALRTWDPLYQFSRKFNLISTHLSGF